MWTSFALASGGLGGGVTIFGAKSDRASPKNVSWASSKRDLRSRCVSGVFVEGRSYKHANFLVLDVGRLVAPGRGVEDQVVEDGLRGAT